MSDLIKILNDMFTLYSALNICVMGMSVGKNLRKGTLNEISYEFNKCLDLFSTFNYQEKMIGTTLLIYYLR